MPAIRCAQDPTPIEGCADCDYLNECVAVGIASPLDAMGSG